MEKYRRFTDEATGINAFVPAARPSTLRSVAAIAATPFVVLAVAACALVYVVLGLVPVTVLGGLASPLHALVVSAVGRAFIALAAWSKTSVVPYPPRPSALQRASDELSAPAPGDVVFANLQGPLDPIALQVAFPRRPLTFVFPKVTSDAAEVPDTQAFVTCTSLFAAASATLGLTTAAASFEKPPNAADQLRPFDLAPLQRSARRQGRVLVVFAEGATTNGRGILRLPRVTCDVDAALHVAGLAYSCPQLSAPVSSASGFLGWLLLEALPGAVLTPNTVDVAILRPSHRPPVPTAFDNNWSITLGTKLAQAASFNRLTSDPCRALNRSAIDKQRFLCQWGQYNAPAAARQQQEAADAPQAAPVRGPPGPRRR